MAMYFGNFISKIPFLQDVECDLRLLIPKGNLAAGLIYPLIGWSYNDDEFIGVFETDLGLNCFRVTAKRSDKNERRRKKNRDEDDMTDAEKEAELISNIRRGAPDNKGYQGSEDFSVIDVELVPFDYFLQSKSKAEFDGFYINQKRVDKIVTSNTAHAYKILEDYNVLAQTGESLYDPKKKDGRRSGYSSYYGSTGLKLYSPFVALLSHKKSPESLYRLESADLFYKQPQLNFLTTIDKDQRPNCEFSQMITQKKLTICYDDPVTTGESSSYYNTCGETHYTYPLEESACALFAKPMLTILFNEVIPSRTPVIVMPDSYGYMQYLSRFKNGRLVGSTISLDRGRKLKSSSSGNEASSVAKTFMERYRKGELGTARCLILDDTADIDQLVEECSIYELTGSL